MTSDAQHSQTALAAAAARAAHLLVDGRPFLFVDDLAEALLGEDAAEHLAQHRKHGGHPVLWQARAQVACRSRYAEDRLGAAVARGVEQYVILGAGLDTFAHRSPLARRLRVFEVDRPATLRWKRRLLERAGIAVPDGVTPVPAELATAGRCARPASTPAGPRS
ncbi:class I SAM-dependent methyltransferase [Streptomyces litchfieldiae]|uniref:S-adenosyl-L-methionine-dependent methyltransferase n=1 Tax=Streptomyces litchfieldiae TaxID=3075543 RepID=A0ABU2MT72_9ACTN|nr:class I SAM-dependent methyltransferase [Streptomyces sp. DSM 44938]MDT0343794.1 class I SAM-dependent methyltransferase [Streptomyces sp. DSM 44938]